MSGLNWKLKDARRFEAEGPPPFKYAVCEASPNRWVGAESAPPSLPGERAYEERSPGSASMLDALVWCEVRAAGTLRLARYFERMAEAAHFPPSPFRDLIPSDQEIKKKETK